MNTKILLCAVVALGLGAALLLAPVNSNAGFPVYGNWGGPGWSGPQAPCDAMDAAFMRHDAKYGQLQALLGRFSKYHLARGYLLADTELVNELRAIPQRSLAGVTRCTVHPAGYFFQTISTLLRGSASFQNFRDRLVAYFLQIQLPARQIAVVKVLATGR